MIFKANEKMDQFKLEMNWNQEELEQWAIAARQKEEDRLLQDNRAPSKQMQRETMLSEPKQSSAKYREQSKAEQNLK